MNFINFFWLAHCCCTTLISRVLHRDTRYLFAPTPFPLPLFWTLSLTTHANLFTQLDFEMQLLHHLSTSDNTSNHRHNLFSFYTLSYFFICLNICNACQPHVLSSCASLMCQAHVLASCASLMCQSHVLTSCASRLTSNATITFIQLFHVIYFNLAFIMDN